MNPGKWARNHMAPVEALQQNASEMGHLLVVDDEHDIVRIFREFLEGQGFTVDTSLNGLEACDKIRARSYDLVITDLVMSPVRGEEVLRAVAEHAPDTETIVITAFPTFDRIQEALRQHVYDFVAKPVDLHRLVSIIRAAVARARESQSRRSRLSQLRERNTHLIDEVHRTTRNLDRGTLEDAVTGLPGYQAFRSILETEISRAIQKRAPLTLGMLQLDQLADIRGTYGRDTGDAFLREAADVLRACLRKTDVLFRYGTEQFAAVFPESGGDAVLNCLERLLRRVRERPWRSLALDNSSAVTLSAGLATVPRDGNSFDELVRAADRALEIAKRGGNSRIHRA